MQVTTGDATFTGNSSTGNARSQLGDQYGDRHINEVNVYYQTSTPRSVVPLPPGPAHTTLSALANVASGLRSYSDGVKPLRGAHRLSKEFSRLSEALKVEHAILSSSLSILASTEQGNLLSASASDCVAGEAPVTYAEGTSVFRDWISHSHSPIRDHLMTIQNAANRFKVSLSLDDSGQVPYGTDERAWRLALSRLRIDQKRQLFRSTRDAIVQANERLRNMALPSTQAPIIDTDNFLDFENPRVSATDLHRVLRDWLDASCKITHWASLSLTAPPDNDGGTNSRHHDDSDFRLIMHHEMKHMHQEYAWVYAEAQVRSHRLGDPDGTGQEPTHSAGSTPEPAASQDQDPPAYQLSMLDFCTTFQEWCVPELRRSTQLGHVTDLNRSHRHAIHWPTGGILELERPAEVTLESLLVTLSLLDRRRVASALAIGMLRLHSTPWLRSRWSKKEVVMFTNNNNPLPWSLSILVNLTHPPTLVPGATSYTSCNSIRNETIFSLGVLLIELALKKPIEQLKNQEDLDAGTHGDFNTAVRLIEQVQADAGFRYADIVRRCIWCDFDLRESNLENIKLQQNVFTGVVAELLKQVADLDPDHEQ